MIFAIDPGNVESAYVMMHSNYDIYKFGKVPNEEMRQIIMDHEDENAITVIEMIASYGMAVGQTVFDTCVWIGRFTELSNNVEYMFRKRRENEYMWPDEGEGHKHSSCLNRQIRKA